LSIGKGIGGHHRGHHGKTNDWITPPHILGALGQFDLDPCQSLTQPWPCAAEGYTIVDDGLVRDWFGRVYCNPPYGDEAWPFMERLAHHRNGIGLLFGRTETQMFRRHIWQEADGVLFLAGRLTFHLPDGSKAKGNSGGPSVLVAYGKHNVESLRTCGLPGALVTQWNVQNMTNQESLFDG
jgi:hypothetical protein